MAGYDLFKLRRELRLSQTEALKAAGIINLGFLTEVEKHGRELSADEYRRIENAWHQYASERQETKKEEAVA